MRHEDVRRAEIMGVVGLICWLYAFREHHYAWGDQEFCWNCRQAMREGRPECPHCGSAPGDCDCAERAACTKAGEVGHWSCGICPMHGKPRHACGCLGKERS